MDELEQIKTLILTMVKAVVSKPDEVELHTEDGTDEKGEYTQINIKVSKPDIRIAIGAKGSTAESVVRIAILHAIRLEYKRHLLIRVDAPRLPTDHFYN